MGGREILKEFKFEFHFVFIDVCNEIRSKYKEEEMF